MTPSICLSCDIYCCGRHLHSIWKPTLPSSFSTAAGLERICQRLGDQSRYPKGLKYRVVVQRSAIFVIYNHCRVLLSYADTVQYLIRAANLRTFALCAWGGRDFDVRDVGNRSTADVRSNKKTLIIAGRPSTKMHESSISPFTNEHHSQLKFSH